MLTGLLVQSRLTLFTLESDTPARAAFEAARAADPTSTIGQNATRYLEAIMARERDYRLWQVEGSASLQYDSNVILQGNLPATLAISHQADGATVFNVSGRVFATRTSLWQAGAEYDFFQNLHFTLHDFDIRSYTFGLFGRAKFDAVTLRLWVSYDMTDLNNALFSGKRSDCQNRTLAITPSDGIPCRHGYASLITSETLGTDFTGNPRPH